MTVKLNQNTNDATPARRLSNFQIKEVSLVDEAANNRKFLIAKSKGADNKDKEIFKDAPGGKAGQTQGDGKTSTTTTKTEGSTKKNVDPVTFAQMVLMANALEGDMGMFFSMVKDLSVNENGNFSMGPELTGRAVSMLEKLSDMLFMFGSDSTLGFDTPAMMAKSLLEKKAGKKGVEKVGKPMNSKRLKAFEDSVAKLQDGVTALQTMLEEVKQSKEVSHMTAEEKKKKETELQKRLAAAQKEKEAEIRKELGLEEGGEGEGDKGDAGDGKAGDDDAAAKGGSEGDDAGDSKPSEEVAKLKAQVAKLEKAEETRKAKAKEDAGKEELADLKKRIAELESAPGSNAGDSEDTDVSKGKKDGDKQEYVEKNGRKVRKGLFKGIMGQPLKDVINAQQGKNY